MKYLVILLLITALPAYADLSSIPNSVYDLKLNGEVIKKCFQQQGNVVLISPEKGECFVVMDWFLKKGFKHTGEIVGSEWNYGAYEGYSTSTSWLILTK